VKIRRAVLLAAALFVLTVALAILSVHQVDEKTTWLESFRVLVAACGIAYSIPAAIQMVADYFSERTDRRAVNVVNAVCRVFGLLIIAVVAIFALIWREFPAWAVVFSQGGDTYVIVLMTLIVRNIRDQQEATKGSRDE